MMLRLGHNSFTCHDRRMIAELSSHEPGWVGL